MSFEVGSPDTVLSQDACRERLSRSHNAFLACTERALPMVVPAEVELRQGRLLVTVRSRALRTQLVGQVVALGVGRPAVWFRRGWRVMARGQMVPADHEDDVALPFEPYQLEGTTFRKVRHARSRL